MVPFVVGIVLVTVPVLSGIAYWVCAEFDFAAYNARGALGNDASWLGVSVVWSRYLTLPQPPTNFIWHVFYCRDMVRMHRLIMSGWTVESLVFLSTLYDWSNQPRKYRTWRRRIGLQAWEKTCDGNVPLAAACITAGITRAEYGADPNGVKLLLALRTGDHA